MCGPKKKKHCALCSFLTFAFPISLLLVTPRFTF